jgi:hypothetical protein
VRTIGTSKIYLFFITGQTGTHDVVITTSVAANVGVVAMAYAGAQQITTDADASGNSVSSGSTEFSCSLTTIADKAWMVAWDYDSTVGNVTPTAPAQTDITQGTATLFSQGPYTPAGANVIKATPTGFHQNDHVFASFAPGAALAVTGGIAKFDPTFFPKVPLGATGRGAAIR